MGYSGGRRINLIKRKFGRLLIIKDTNERKDDRIIWLCKCDCGNLTKVSTKSLTTGNTKSCGCLLKEVAKNLKTIHGDHNTRLFRCWQNMKKRCNNILNKRYGSRGIRVCDEWENNYSAFKNWALNNGYKNNLSIDRINNNGDYEPNNCQWISRAENSRKSVILFIKYRRRNKRGEFI